MTCAPHELRPHTLRMPVAAQGPGSAGPVHSNRKVCADQARQVVNHTTPRLVPAVQAGALWGCCATPARRSTAACGSALSCSPSPPPVPRLPT